MAYTTIDDPSAHFQTLIWTGNDVDGRALTNDGNSDLQPDLVWLKNTDLGYNHHLTDSTRGVGVNLSTNLDAAESSWANLVESFDTDGFTVGDDGSQVPNHTGNKFVAWQWKANGGTTASNTSGSINSTVQANTTAGFSIVTFTGNGTDGATVAHGLGAVPAMVIFKCRDTANTDWRVYHQSISPTNALSINDSGAQYGASSIFTSVFTSTLLKLENDTGVNRNTSPMIAYCFSEVQGYSKFGSYIGNGSGTSDGTFNGPFVYTGFKPAYVLIKPSSASAGDGWVLFDNTRYPRGSTMTTYGNYINNQINPGTSSAESGNVYDAVDFLSNGFKARTGRDGVNDGGRTYIYAAFAENPFVTSTGVPCTAR